MPESEKLALLATIARQRVLLAEALAVMSNVSWPSQKTKDTRAAVEAELATKPMSLACWCETCRPLVPADMRMVLCPTCGDKRCQRARSHDLACEAGEKLMAAARSVA